MAQEAEVKQGYKVFRGVGTDSFLVARSETDGFLWDAKHGAAGPHVRPGSATAHMCFVEWRRVGLAAVPAALLREIERRGLLLADAEGGGK
jgi:hypothetical protein